MNFIQKVLDAPVEITQAKIDLRIKYLENTVYELERQSNLWYQFKKFILEKCKIIYYVFLPKPVQKVIMILWEAMRGIEYAAE